MRIYIHVLLHRLGGIAGNHFNGQFSITFNTQLPCFSVPGVKPSSVHVAFALFNFDNEDDELEGLLSAFLLPRPEETRPTEPNLPLFSNKTLTSVLENGETLVVSQRR